MGKKKLRKIDISEIKNPDFLRDLNIDELNQLAKDIRSYIVNITSKYGGHLSSNLGSIESTIALCYVFDFSKDKIVFDVGHQCYTYKILTGRSLEGLRTKGGPSGFQKMSESDYDHFEAGHSSTSISVVNGMAIARDLNKEKFDVIAYIGDGSIVNGLALEGLNLTTHTNHKSIIVLNDNDMSISKPVGALARTFRKISTSTFYNRSKSFVGKVLGRRISRFLSKIKNWFKRHLVAINIFDIFGYAVIGPIDGHDIKVMIRAFKKAKKLNRSVVVHIKTVKGNGYEYAENDKVGDWHGVGKFDVESGEQIHLASKISWSQEYEEILHSCMKSHPEAITICPATGLGSHLSSIFTDYPDRAIDVGIAEEHAVTMAAGLSISGKHPIISIYSTFLQRAYDEIHHDVARMKLSMTFLIDRSGLVGADGDTHQGLYDEGFLYSIPNTIIAMASNKREANFLLEESFNHQAPFFIRYPKEVYVDYRENDEALSFGKWIVVKEASKKDIAIVSVGPLLRELEAKIINKKLDVTLVNALFVRPLDNELIEKLCDYKTIIIYDPYSTVEGFARHVEVKLLENEFKGKVIVKAVPNQYVGQASISEQRKEFAINTDSIMELISK